MPASASIHFCFHYASFLRSFQINFNASLNFEVYKKTLVLPTLVNWDPFRNPEDAFALVLGGELFPLLAFSGFLVLSARKHPDPRSEDGAMLQMSDPCPKLCWVGQSQQGSPEPHPHVPVLGRLVGAGVVPQKPSQSWGEHCG